MNTIRITIEKGSKAEKAVKALIKQKEDFRNALQSGKAEEYVKKNRGLFSQPI